ncbi:lipopolysaccharide biosynthesis protein [Thalassospira xiamenensis]|uniref:lipopolysaccharide biosynthesis protein n=1 Tax=Thalassospira xiamenensis TaxID=220697 RepID=UPI003AA91D18
MSIGQSIAKQILLGGLTQFLVSFRGLIIMPIIVKTAGDSTFGTYVLLSSVVVFLSGISSFGTNYAFRRELPAADTSHQRRALLIPSLTFRIASTAIFSILLYFGAQHLLVLTEESMPFSPGYLILWLLGLTAQETATDYYRYTSRFGTFNLLTIGQIYIHIGATIGVVLWRHELSLDMLLLLHGGSLLILALPTLLFGILRETGVSKPIYHLPKFWRDTSLGLPLTGEFIIDFLVAFGDRYLIGLFLSAAAVGQYQASYALAGLLVFFPKLLGTILPPTLCRLWDENKPQQAEKLVSHALRLFLVLAIPFCVGALIVGPSILATLTTREIAYSGRWALALIALAMLFYGIVIILSSVTFVTRQTSVIFAANLIAMVMNLGLNLALISSFPTITIPAAVSIAAYASAAAYALIKVRPSFQISFPWPSLIRSLFATLIMTVGLVWCNYMPGSVETTDIISLTVTIAGAIGSYFAVFLLIGGLQASDITLLAGLFRRQSK